MDWMSASDEARPQTVATGPRRRISVADPAADTARLKTGARDRYGLPPVTVDRLIRCCRLCMRLERDGREFTSSRELGELLGCKSSLIRRDFSRLGKLGTLGHGYRLAGLIHDLKEVLGICGPVTAVLVGAGLLGAALLARGGGAYDGFRFLAAFDFDPSKAGTNCDGLVVNHVSRMSDVLGDLDVNVGVLAV